MSTTLSGLWADKVRARLRRRWFGNRPPAAFTSVATYKAFISYSHAVDGRLAPGLQSGLQQFAKRWSQIRALRVFRDQTSLSADPALWPSIERALRASEFFILLASPTAAASPWVNREVSWWLTERSHATLLVVLTAGEIGWDSAQGRLDPDRTTALPPTLRDAIRQEPRYVDLRWAAGEDDLSMRNPRFREGVADLAATLHGRPKDELFGEDVRQHRRTTRLARAAVTVIALLAVGATVAAVVAVTEQRRATTQARVATSRQLAVTASTSVDTEFDLALLLAVQALRIEDIPVARASLFSALERNPQHVRFLRASRASVAAVEISADGDVVVAGDVGGTVAVWSVPEGAPLRRLQVPGSAAVEDVAVSASGMQVAAGSGDGDVMIWDLATGEGRRVYHHAAAVSAVAFSPDGDWVASGDRQGTAVVTEVATGAVVVRVRHHSGFDPGVDRLSFSPDGGQLSVGSDGAVTLWEVGDGQELFSGGAGLGAHTTFAVFSDDLRLQAEAVGGGGHGVYVSSLDGGSDLTAISLTGEAEALAFSPDGDVLAVAGQGAIRLFGTQSLEPDPDSPVVAGYPAPVASISFSNDRRWMAAASGDAVVLSDLSLRHRLGRVVAEPQDVCNACLDDRAAAISPDGMTLAWLDPGGFVGPGRVRFWDITRREAVGSFDVGTADVEAVAFAPDGRSVVTGNPVAVWDLDGTRLSPPRVNSASGASVSAASFTADGHGLAAARRIDVDGDGWTVYVRDLSSGRDVLTTPPTETYPASAMSAGETLAVGEDGGSIAVWDLRTRRRVAVLQPDRLLTGMTGEDVGSLSFDAAGEQLASVSGGIVTVWDVERQEAGATLRWGGRGHVRFSPDGRLLAAGRQDGAMTLWDLPSGVPLGTVVGQDPRGVSPELVFTPDGSMMASVVGGGGLMLWDLSVENWIRAACAVADRDLTAAEWDRHVGGAFDLMSTCDPLNQS